MGNTKNQINEYKGLSYKPENVNPKGRPRVYFCCHEQDFEKYFEPISDEIRKYQSNATIWFYNPALRVPQGEDFEADLSQMQLFVIPVTPKLYKKMF